MKRIAVLTSLFIFLSSWSAFGQSDIDPERLDIAVQMVEHMEVEEEAGQIQARMLHEMLSVNPMLEPFKGVIAEFLDRYASWKVMKGELAVIYAEEFTAEELKALAKFYASPLGKKVSARTSEIFEKTIAATQKNLELHQAELETMITERVKEIKAAEKARKESDQPM